MSDTTTSPQTTEPAVDYKSTLNLPQTAFQMKANASQREPQLEAMWDEQRLYDKAMAKNKANPRFLLHDGPPYLSADQIHIGTALNKVLKDIITKYKTQQGFYCPYVPGYDGHGLPIENAVVKALPNGRESLTPYELRQQCRAFAMTNVVGQTNNFKRLGVWGNWEQPYLTIDGQFEAIQIKLFWDMYQKGYVYKGLKPVYWDPVFETALAEAEVEYEDVTSTCIYVGFKAIPGDLSKLPESIQAGWDNTTIIIWTTTPWTIPANLGLCFNESIDYVVLDTPHHGRLVMAQALVDQVIQHCDLGNYTVVGTAKGSAFEGLTAQHPLYDRPSQMILGDHVTTDAGTGIVHTAPGHGMEDYVVGQRYGLDILSPIDNKGHFTEAAGPDLAGVFYAKGNGLVVQALEAAGALLGQHTITHSYPHSWRSHKPVIFRATEQWFISVDQIRGAALEQIKQVAWVPEVGQNRISSMVENRGDWCISRQRAWGVPIPVFYHKSTGEVVINDTTIEKVYQHFKADSSDVWWKLSPEELLGADYNIDGVSPADLVKEMDIMDVWFDSGVTHTAVVEHRHEELGHLPVDLYLEGSDQHRGWFQSSLLTSVMVHGQAPFKTVLTHGFVLDQQGRKMSKSLGNVVAPQAIIEELGADILRLWVASVDYTSDVKIGKDTIKQLTDVYRKIRNTVRFILSNLYDFNASTDLIPLEQLSELDRYVLHRLNTVVSTITDAFDHYQFHKYYQVLQNFCVQELSNLYFDCVKDGLYANSAGNPQRRGVQTVLYALLTTLPAMLVPVMPHMAEDIWQSIPVTHKPSFGQSSPPESILLAPWPQVKSEWTLSATDLNTMEQVLALKRAVNLLLEQPRANGHIGSSLEASVVVVGDQPPFDTTWFGEFKALSDWLILSDIQFQSSKHSPSSVPLAEGTVSLIPTGQQSAHHYQLVVLASSGQKCVRCWRYATTVGHHTQHAGLCQRCVTAITA